MVTSGGDSSPVREYTNFFPAIIKPKTLNFSMDLDVLPANINGDANMGLGSDSIMLDIFNDAHQLPRQDRFDVVAESQRIQSLLDFISAHCHSLQEVNEFSTNGAISRKVNADNVFVKSSLRKGSDGYVSPGASSTEAIVGEPNSPCCPPLLPDIKLEEGEFYVPDMSLDKSQSEPDSALLPDSNHAARVKTFNWDIAFALE